MCNRAFILETRYIEFIKTILENVKTTFKNSITSSGTINQLSVIDTIDKESNFKIHF